MKFTCAQADLAAAIGITIRAVAPRTTLAILTHVRLEAARPEGSRELRAAGEKEASASGPQPTANSPQPGELRLSATNLRVGISCWIEATVEQAGSIALPARLLDEVVGKLAAGTVVLELNERTQVVTVRQGRTEVKIAGLDADDFPAMPDVPQMDSIEFDVALLRQALMQAAYAAARDEARPVVHCVKLEIQQERLVIVATDGFRLALRTTPLGSPLADTQVSTLLLQVPIVDELIRVIGGKSQEVRLFLPTPAPAKLAATWRHDNAAIFLVENDDRRVLLSAQLVDARYPDYATIIPKGDGTKVLVDRSAFVRLLQMARLFAEDEKRSVKLAISTSCLRVASNQATAGESAGEIEASVQGKPLEITLQVGYLLEALGQIDTAQVEIEANGANRPICLRPTGVSREEALHVIMPMGGK